jgi:hypothetical protein
MVKAARAFASLTADAVMDSLRVHGITFRGLFQTPRGNVLFSVESHLFLELELVAVFKRNKRHREGVQELARYNEASDRGAQP